MSQRVKVSGTRSIALWILILIAAVLVVSLVVGVLIIYPNYQNRQQVEQHYQAGVAFQETENWDKAAEAFEKVIAINATYKDARTRLVEVREKEQQATNMARAAAATATADALEARYQKGLAYMNLEQWNSAKAEMEQVFNVDPNYRNVQTKLQEINDKLRLVVTSTTVSSTPTLPPTATSIAGCLWRDDFDSPVLAREWTWLNEDATHWSLTTRPGHLRIWIQEGDIWGDTDDAYNLLLRPVALEGFVITTKLTIDPKTHAQQAGLIVWQDTENYVRLTRGYFGGYGSQLEFVTEQQNRPQRDGVSLSDLTVYLGIARRGSRYTGYYSLDGSEWIEVTSYSDPALQPSRVGLGGWTASAPEIPADFDWLCIGESLPKR